MNYHLKMNKERKGKGKENKSKKYVPVKNKHVAKILLYTFYNPRQLPFKILTSLKNKNVQKYFLGNLATMLKNIEKERYDYILGLGDYRKDSKKIRIETSFINKYGRRRILEDSPEKFSSIWKISPTPQIYFSEKASNGPCNRSAYLITDLISKNNLLSKLAFIHIPKSYSPGKSLKFISSLVNSNYG